MKGLKAVYGLLVKRNGVAPTEAVGTALVDGLRENKKLQRSLRTKMTGLLTPLFLLMSHGKSISILG
jgi:hypothetical protein